MNAVINGKSYSTDTAEQVATFESDFNGGAWRVESLFRKRTGEFFLWVNGGEIVEHILPLSYADAKAWAKENAIKRDFSRYFDADGDAEVTLSFKVDGSTNAKMRRVASERGLSLKQLLQEMVNAL